MGVVWSTREQPAQRLSFHAIDVMLFGMRSCFHEIEQPEIHQDECRISSGYISYGMIGGNVQQQ